MEDHNKIARTRFLTPHISHLLSSFYVISIEFVSPQKGKGDWFFELNISQALNFYSLKFVILENCGAHYYHTKYMEEHNKIGRTRLFTPHISHLLCS
jgi:hypothetical protein